MSKKQANKIRELKEENMIRGKLLRRIRSDLNYIRKEGKYKSSTPLAIISARIEEINRTLKPSKRSKK